MLDYNWLNQVQEEILEPDLPICDPHHHLWDYEQSVYLLDEIQADANAGHNIQATVFMECGSAYRSDGPIAEQPLGETEFVMDIANRSAGPARICEGIVGYADLGLGQGVRDVLTSHLEIAPAHFKGIRHATGWHQHDNIRNSHTNPTKNLMLDDKFREGFSVLETYGLSFDAWFYHPQLPDFIDLVKAFPNTTIILDHFGGPLGIGPYTDKLDDVFLEWQEQMALLEGLPNLYFKLGGLNMKINGFKWHDKELPPTSDQLVDKTARYYEHVINHFGADHCMFESNFPVDSDSVSYHVLWNAFKKMSRSYSDSERADLFFNTAARVYRLE